MKNIFSKYIFTDSTLIKYVGLFFTLVSLWFVVSLLFKNINNFAFFYTNKSLLLAITFGLFFYAISQINAVFSWFLLLRDRYPAVTFKIQYIIISVSQIGKYLPGNVAHMLGRAYLSKKHGFKIIDVSKYILVESILLIYASILVGLGYFLYFENGLEQLGIANHWLLYAVLSALVIIPLLLRKKNHQTKLINVSAVYVIGLNIISFCALGMVVYVFQQLITDADVSLIKYIIAISIAFVIGFVVPGAPAGIGVREYVFIVLLSNDLNSATALNLIMALRIVNVLGDLLMYLSSYWVKKCSK